MVLEQLYNLTWSLFEALQAECIDNIVREAASAISRAEACVAAWGISTMDIAHGLAPEQLRVWA